MSRYAYSSGFAVQIEAALSHREMLGYSRKPHASTLRGFDRFCKEHFPAETELSKTIVLEWMKERPSKSTAGSIRFLGKYLDAMGLPAYVLPDGFIGGKTSFAPYIFTDEELRALFTAADTLTPSKKCPFRHIIAPVIFRLIYTCGLRPNEGRELPRDNINFDTGEGSLRPQARVEDKSASIYLLIFSPKSAREKVVAMSNGPAYSTSSRPRKPFCSSKKTVLIPTMI